MLTTEKPTAAQVPTDKEILSAFLETTGDLESAEVLRLRVVSDSRLKPSVP